MLICLVVAFNFLAFLAVKFQNVSNFLRRRRERINTMKNKVVRLKPLAIKF